MNITNKSSPNPKESDVSRRKLVIIYIGMISVPVLWGTTFVATRALINLYPIFFTTFVRHLIAFLGFFPYFKRYKNMDKRTLRGAFLSGSYYFWAVILQTYGLRLTTSGIAGFITALYIILIPIFLFIFWKRKISRSVIKAILFATLGLFILFFNPEDFTGSRSAVNQADSFMHSRTMGIIYIIGAAILFAFELIVMEKYLMESEESGGSTDNPDKTGINGSVAGEKIEKADPYLFAMNQLLITTILALIFAPIFGESIEFDMISSYGWKIFIYLGLAGTTLPFLFQNLGQKHVSSEKAGIIFSTEPIFASIFGIIIDNEPFYWQLVVGGFLIMSGIFIVLRPTKENSDKKVHL